MFTIRTILVLLSFISCRSSNTESFRNSYDRINRYPYLLKRWKGPIVSVFIIQEIEFRALMEFILQQTRSILFNIYIIPTYTITPFIYQGKHKYYMPNGIYPFNVLRDIGIESITTTHYLLLDIDVFPSRNLYDDILNNKQILYDYNSVLLLQLFQYAKKKTKGITDMNVFYEL